MAGMQEEFARRWDRKPPHDWRADYSAPGFEVPEPAPSCAECGPGYRIGDEGCRHGAAALAEQEADRA